MTLAVGLFSHVRQVSPSQVTVLHLEIEGSGSIARETQSKLTLKFLSRICPPGWIDQGDVEAHELITQ